MSIVSSVSTAATEAQSTFFAIIGSVAPFVFLGVVVLVCIGLGIKLFRKSDGGDVHENDTLRDLMKWNNTSSKDRPDGWYRRL